MRSEPFIRQWKMARLLMNTPKGIHYTELCKQMEAPRRTVYRDLEALRNAGFAVFTHPAGVWHCVPEPIPGRLAQPIPMRENLEVAELVERYYTDLAAEGLKDNDRNLGAWLWFSCPARLRKSVATAVAKLRTEKKKEKRKQ